MNKKKLTSMLVSLGLVAALGAGATLAALTAETEELTNTFKFTDQGITISLDEAKVGEDNKALADESRIDAGETQNYQNLLPNMVIDKDPTVTVEQGSLNCNVFVSVENANGRNLVITDLNSNAWDELEVENGEVNTKYYVYKGSKATGTPDGTDTFKVVNASEADVVLEDIFEHVRVGDLDDAVKFEDIVIKAAAVQADNVTDEEATATALEMLIGE